MSLGLDGRRVLLTGASGGLGQAIARELHSRGATLLLTGRRADALEELQSELGERAETIPADLADPEQSRTLVERAGAVDVLVANAGLPASGRLRTFSPEEIDRALDVNLRSPMQLARALAPGMVERGSGHVVFVSSLSGKVATAGASVYCATKFGLRGFGSALRQELHGTGVGVTTVFPGFIREAGMWADSRQKLPGWIRLRSPEQVAAAVREGIEEDRAEIDVAPVILRAAGWVAGIAPRAISTATRALGGHRTADALADAQRAKR